MTHVSLRVQAFLEASGQPRLRWQQYSRGVFRRHERRVSDLTSLPADLRRDVASEFGDEVVPLRVRDQRARPQANKTMFEAHDGALLESVLVTYRDGWRSLCISSQVGCGYRCSFCATGSMGLVRNLTSDEIVGQLLWHLQERIQVRTVAFMGMGEPLANPHTFDALEVLTSPDLLGWSPRRFTVSTVGHLPGLRRLVTEHPRVDLTVSVHSPFPEQRRVLVPAEWRWSLGEVLDVAAEHARRRSRRITLAYTLLDAVNDTDEHAEALACVIDNLDLTHQLVTVSLIPYNDAGVNNMSRSARVSEFGARLRGSGINTTIRYNRGTDLAAGCGQLVTASRRLPVKAR